MSQLPMFIVQCMDIGDGNASVLSSKGSKGKALCKHLRVEVAERRLDYDTHNEH